MTPQAVVKARSRGRQPATTPAMITGLLRAPVESACPVVGAAIRSCPYGEPRRVWIGAAVVLLVWLAMRLVFFVGYGGSDDMYHVRFAALWDRTPANHWEARLLFNVCLRYSMAVLGRVEWAAVLPSMLASAITLTCIVLAAGWWFTPRCAFWAGLIVATIPIDVEGATSVTAYTPMTAFLILGTVLTLGNVGVISLPRAATDDPCNTSPPRQDMVALQPKHDRRLDLAHRFGTSAAVAAFAFAVLMHRIALVYIAAMIVGLLVGHRMRAARLVTALIVGMGITLLIEHACCALAFRDFTLPTRTAFAQSLSENPDVPLRLDGRLNPRFFLWPPANFAACKGFGVTLLVATLGFVSGRRRLPAPFTVLLVTGLLFWAYLSYGSQSPIDYRPFWRMARFWHPLLPMAAIGAALFITRWKRPGQARLVGLGVIGAHVLLLSAGGAWGRNVEISRELLGYAQRHPDGRFITDYHTWNETYIANGVERVPNIVVADDVEPWKLLDRAAPRVNCAMLVPEDLVLVNPINAARRPEFARLIDEIGGDIVHRTAVRPRLICQFIPGLADRAWAVRQPAARVVRVARDRVVTRSKVDTDDAAQSTLCTGR